ncbi:ADP-heptose--LPS heptosyltransferase 2 [Vibrio aerogenes CECT 7868]|uniref:lipopolysaccharide heptosyltransferase II n=2 Tax=Vibrio aerogenes TaxID=92172 RepID=A0A1M5ZDL4_9VIBR|nr:ADP-heptose--LPS heptosyltransferase 2 [Vibrio aerogenes CECT 7868]
MVMSQSLYIELKKRHPESTIAVLAPKWCNPVLQRMPEVDQILEMPIGHGKFDLKGRWKIGRQLIQENFTHAFVLPNSAKSALIPLFAGIKHRTGWKGESRYGLLNDLRPRKQVFQYMVERYVALASSKETMLEEVALASCPKPKLVVDSEQQAEVCSRLGLSKHGQVVGMCPGAEFGPAKRWPEKYYAELALYLIEQGHQVCIFGSAKDQNVSQAIYRSLPEEARKHCFDLAGQTSLSEVVDLLAMCHTVFCNDSGLMHISAAVGVRIVAIYGSTSTRYTPPLTDRCCVVHTDISCRPCFKRECPLEHLNCLNQLSVQQVIQAYETLNISTSGNETL